MGSLEVDKIHKDHRLMKLYKHIDKSMANKIKKEQLIYVFNYCERSHHVILIVIFLLSRNIITFPKTFDNIKLLEHNSKQFITIFVESQKYMNGSNDNQIYPKLLVLVCIIGFFMTNCHKISWTLLVKSIYLRTST